MVEPLGKHFASDVFENYSAGTEIKEQINQDAVRLMKEIYSIDMEENQHSKLLSDIPPVDVAIKMGCNVVCPFIANNYEEDWGLNDPTDKSDEEFKKIIYTIEMKIKELKEKLKVL